MNGTIKKLVAERGFGFIREEGGSTEYFFHRSGVPRSIGGYDVLSEGQAVTFDIEDSMKGPRATNVQPRSLRG